MEYILGGIILFGLCLAFLALTAKPLGIYVFRVFDGKITFLRFLEKRIYRFCAVGPDKETGWRRYAIDVLLFNLIGIIFLFIILMLQSYLPLNPQNLGGFTWDLAINTAVSFVTNTNWQAYSGESTASYFTLMIGLAVQNFLSAATGICIAIALIRGIARQGSATIGNFWVDITRCTLYLLLPFCFIFALLLVSQGVIQNFDPYVNAVGAGGQQIIPMGPVASQEAIKELGTNGGGFFNANSAHPYENPNPLTNLVEIFLLLSVPFALTYTFGLMVKDTRQGWSIFAVMIFLLFSACLIGYFVELQGNPELNDQNLTGSYMEGKEARFSVAESVLFSSATTATSTGAVNTMHDSLTPLCGLVPLVLMLLGEIAPGGVGSGIYTILPYVIIAVFIAGLMVGRSPQYLGKKIDALDMKASVVIILISPILVLAFSGLALFLPEGISSIYNPGPHGLTEVLYAYASMANNNGSAFAGLGANTVFYNLTGALVMFLGRFVSGVAALALAGSLAKKTVYSSRDVFHTHNLMFILWLIGVIILVDSISFLPAFALGPIIEHLMMLKGVSSKMPGIFQSSMVTAATINAIKKLNPFSLWRNPVMFSAEVGSVITTIEVVTAYFSGKPVLFLFWITVWLWLTVLFGTFAESFAELRGKAKTDELKKTRSNTTAKIVEGLDFDSEYEVINATQLSKGDLVLLEAGDVVPSDGEVVAGSALVDESAVTGESAPVVRESGGDRCGVVAGAKLLSNKCIIRITVNPGETFIDRMINMIDAAKRPKTPNEIALEILLLSLTIIFLFVCANFWALTYYSSSSVGRGEPVSVAVLVALFVCLAPTTIAALLPAIGIAGMDRLFKKNVIVLSGKAVEAAGDISTILLDKTGTITYGNRQAVEFIPAKGRTEKEVAEIAFISSIGDETPEGKSITNLASEKLPDNVCPVKSLLKPVPFSPQTRMSGVDYNGHIYRKGAPDTILEMSRERGERIPEGIESEVDRIANLGGTPLLLYLDNGIIGVVYLKDVLKQGIKERLAELRVMGIRTIILTGDNPLTAACIAKEAGVEDFVAQAKPQDKLRIIREEQAKGWMVAMTGDGTNDAPALAQADVAVAMSEGTQVAKEAANMIDLDNHPAKLIDIVKIGKEILMTRGALTTFSIANDLAKYFAIVPAALYTTYPELGAFNILQLKSPETAILSAVIFNAIIILLMVPLALKGVKYKAMPVQKVFQRNLLIYGFGGIIVPFIGIKIIDLIIGMFI